VAAFILNDAYWHEPDLPASFKIEYSATSKVDVFGLCLCEYYIDARVLVTRTRDERARVA
jgi:hypothetical protein